MLFFNKKRCKKISTINVDEFNKSCQDTVDQMILLSHNKKSKWDEIEKLTNE